MTHKGNYYINCMQLKKSLTRKHHSVSEIKPKNYTKLLLHEKITLPMLTHKGNDCINCMQLK